MNLATFQPKKHGPISKAGADAILDAKKKMGETWTKYSERFPFAASTLNNIVLHCTGNSGNRPTYNIRTENAEKIFNIVKEILNPTSSTTQAEETVSKNTNVSNFSLEKLGNMAHKLGYCATFTKIV